MCYYTQNSQTESPAFHFKDSTVILFFFSRKLHVETTFQDGGTEQQNTLIYNIMNRVGIVLLRGVGRAGSSIVCYGRRGPPICHLLMCQYSSLSHHKRTAADDGTTQQQRTKVTSSDLAVQQRRFMGTSSVI